MFESKKVSGLLDFGLQIQMMSDKKGHWNLRLDFLEETKIIDYKCDLNERDCYEI